MRERENKRLEKAGPRLTPQTILFHEFEDDVAIIAWTTDCESSARVDDGRRWLVAIHEPKRDRPPLARYFLKYIQAVSASKTIATIQSDELFISVFFAMDGILSEKLALCESGNRG